jgi:hypothetical protein
MRLLDDEVFHRDDNLFFVCGEPLFAKSGTSISHCLAFQNSPLVRRHSAGSVGHGRLGGRVRPEQSPKSGW